MKTLFRILGTAAAVAVTGAAIVALDKILNQKDPLHVEEVEFPEEAEQDAAEAEKTAEAYAEAEAKAADDAAEQPTAPAEADAPEAPAEPAPAQEPATLEDTSEGVPVHCHRRRHHRPDLCPRQLHAQPAAGQDRPQ